MRVTNPGLFLLSSLALTGVTGATSLARGADSPLQACHTVPVNIPDGNATGVDIFIEIPCPQATIEDLDVSLQVSHTWVGDLTFTVTHVDTGTSAVIIDRPGSPASFFGCSGNDIDATLSDEAATAVENECAPTVPTISGTFIAGDPPDDTLMASFDGEEFCGTWKVNVADPFAGDTGSLNEWCVIANSGDGGDGGGGADGGEVPSTTGTGAVLLVLALLGSAALALRLRAAR